MTFSLFGRSTMLRNTRVQMAAVLAVGALLGYLAASGKVNPFSRVEAAPSPPEPASGKPEEAGSGAKPGCCDDLCKGQLLARAENKGNAAFEEAQNTGKKPNILFIMGDDVGWFNIGAYHRG